MKGILFCLLIATQCLSIVTAQSGDLRSFRQELENFAQDILNRPNGTELCDPEMAPLYDALFRAGIYLKDANAFGELLRFGDLSGWQAMTAGDPAENCSVAATWLRVESMDSSQTYRGDPSRQAIEKHFQNKKGWGDIFLPAALLRAAHSHLPTTDDFLSAFAERPAETFLSLGLLLEAAADKSVEVEPLSTLFQQLAGQLLKVREESGFWPRTSMNATTGRLGLLTPTAVVCLGYGMGIRMGILEREAYLPVLLEVRTAVDRRGLQIDRYEPWELAFLLSAGTELYAILDDARPNAVELLKVAEAGYRSDNRLRAVAAFVPRRKDDLAWENDRMAFRIYGPALIDSAEDSGIDAWIKRVQYPIIEKWYRLDLAGEKSYHTDSGEGYDGYKVGPRRGCGGAGIWEDGKLVNSNVYDRHAIYWTRRDTAAFTAWYSSPNGVEEEKRFKIQLGDTATHVESVFTREGKPVAGLEVAVGLTAQGENSITSFASDTGRLQLSEQLADDALVTFVRWNPNRYTDAVEQRIQTKKAKESLVILPTDEKGTLAYEIGFSIVD